MAREKKYKMNNILHEAKEEREQPNGIAQEREREKPGRRPGPSRCCLCVIVFILFLRILFFLFVCLFCPQARESSKEGARLGLPTGTPSAPRAAHMLPPLWCPSPTRIPGTPAPPLAPFSRLLCVHFAFHHPFNLSQAVWKIKKNEKTPLTSPHVPVFVFVVPRVLRAWARDVLLFCVRVCVPCDLVLNKSLSPALNGQRTHTHTHILDILPRQRTGNRKRIERSITPSFPL